MPSDPLITPLPSPDNVNPNAPVTPPPSVSVPASEAIIDAAPKVTKPLSVFEPLTFKSAPLCPAKPFPLIVKGSAPKFNPPCNCMVAPEDTTVCAAVPPSAVAFCTFNTPASTDPTPR